MALIPEYSVASSLRSVVNVSSGIHTASSCVPVPLSTFPYSASEAGISKFTSPIPRRTAVLFQPIGTPNVSFEKNPPTIGKSLSVQDMFCCIVSGSDVKCEVAKKLWFNNIDGLYEPLTVKLSPVSKSVVVAYVLSTAILQVWSHSVCECVPVAPATGLDFLKSLNDCPLASTPSYVFLIARLYAPSNCSLQLL